MQVTASTPTSSTAMRGACEPAGSDRPCMPCLLARGSQGGGVDLLTRRVAAGSPLFLEGERLHSLYAVRCGMFKLTMAAPRGQEQVTAFRVAGELIGLDAIADERHVTSAVALEDSEVFPVPVDSMQALIALEPDLARGFLALLGRELVRDQRRTLLLGSLGAEERVAAFLLNLAHRSGGPRQPATELLLPMTRADIGNYLGLTMETVSRILHRFEDRGWLRLARGRVERLDIPRLQAFFRPASAPGAA